jgi:hypothetical protein
MPRRSPTYYTATDAAGSSASHLVNVSTGPTVVGFILSP